MRDYSVRAACRGAVRVPADLSVTIDNRGPARTFRAVLAVRDTDIVLETEVPVGSMSSGTVVFDLPPSPSERPVDRSAVVTVTADGREPAEATVRFVHLPAGWFDRLDPDLPGSLCSYTAGFRGGDGAGDALMGDLSRAYAGISALKPRAEERSRYLYVAPPEAAAEFGDCTDAEAAVSFMGGMLSSGYDCCLVVLGGDCYVGVSRDGDATRVHADRAGAVKGSFVFVRPFDGCSGIPLDVSLDRSRSRMGSVLPANPDAGFLSVVRHRRSRILSATRHTPD
ncbi:MAG: hypothetical protein Q4Q62_07995 [Thermoplasmata archaeon]|nr:hypothetical protein [Thermoplasmata archaeon]